MMSTTPLFVRGGSAGPLYLKGRDFCKIGGIELPGKVDGKRHLGCTGIEQENDFLPVNLAVCHVMTGAVALENNLIGLFH